VPAMSKESKLARNEKGAYLLTPESEDYQVFLWKAVKYINEQSDSKYHFFPVNVTKAERLLVSGDLYTFEFEVVETGESKEAITHEQLRSSSPPPKEGAKRHVYEVKIWSKPWMDFEEYTIVNSKEI
uniref:Cystatin domain-containing protein n=1 Tax=Steinernema glaseri TaxID=37863 RepID=A0A1I7Z068_9BILA